MDNCGAEIFMSDNQVELVNIRAKYKKKRNINYALRKKNTKSSSVY